MFYWYIMRLLQINMAFLKNLIIIMWAVACTNGDKFSSFNKEVDSLKIIHQAGYPGEEHKVQTEDGYILTIHRIMPARGLHVAEKRFPVYLQHGLTSSSFNWINPGPEQALPFILSDEGYDVWMGNCRGNSISKEHAFLSKNMEGFWDFSFHEMGVYDLPAMINYVLNATKEQQLYYIGNSMGSTIFFVMASLRPEVATKVHFAVILAPVVTVEPVRNFLRMGMKFLEIYLLTNKKQSEVLSRNGVSKRTLLHFLQLYLSGTFSMFDYGVEMNKQKYNSTIPPSYAMRHIAVPVLICYGTEDPFATEKDVKTLHSSLGAAVGLWSVPINHFEFSRGRIPKKEFYNAIASQLYKFTYNQF